jgi:hypothetical protein
MQITDPSQLSVGMKIYLVHAFTDDRKKNNCTLCCHEVVAFSTGKKTGAFAKFKDVPVSSTADRLKLDYDNGVWETQSFYNSLHVRESSLQDMGIVANTYNDHQTYDDAMEAHQYLAKLLGFVDSNGKIILTIKSSQLPSTRNSQAAVLSKPALEDTDYDRAMRVV